VAPNIVQVERELGVDPDDFRAPGRLAVLAAAVGSTRLIDNQLLGDRL